MEKENQPRLKRILSLDGGGIRGILVGRILMALETKLNAEYTRRNGTSPARPIRLAQYFDMMAGTSTGGILTCLMLCPSEDDATYPRFSAEDAVNLYLQNASTIFKRTFYGKLPSPFEGIGGVKYGSLGIEDLMKKYMKDYRLSDMILPCLITSYDIQARKAVFFTSKDALERVDENFLMWQVARSTSAAPTYFPPAIAHIKEDALFHTIDGGLFANNPTMCAVVEALKIFKSGGKKLASPDEFMVLSIGTGSIKKEYPFKQAVKWGVLRWLKPIIDIMMSGVSETVDYQLRKLYATIDCSKQYHRIIPELGDADSEMDNITPKNLAALVAAGDMSARNIDVELNEIVGMLLDNDTVVNRLL